MRTHRRHTAETAGQWAEPPPDIPPPEHHLTPFCPSKCAVTPLICLGSTRPRSFASPRRMHARTNETKLFPGWTHPQPPIVSERALVIYFFVSKSLLTGADPGFPGGEAVLLRPPHPPGRRPQGARPPLGFFGRASGTRRAKVLKTFDRLFLPNF